MIKKIIHCSDLHIRNFKMHDQHKEAFNAFIKHLKDLKLKYEYDECRIVIVGDLFHQKITVSNEQFVLAHTFLKVCAKYFPVIIIAGNHDLLENNKDRLDSITPIIDTLRDSNITYYKDRGCFKDDNVVWCVYSIFESNIPPDITKAKNEFGDDLIYIGLFHGPVLGAKTDLGYKFEHGVNLAYFEGCDIVLLGDIHKRSDFEYNGTKIAFSGSFLQQNYGENLKGHGYLIWDLESKSYSAIDLPSSYGLYKFEINSIDDLENNNEILVNE